MAARLLQRGAAAPVAAMLLGGVVLYPRTAHAEAPDNYAKKPIYDDYYVPSPAPLSAAKSPAAPTPSSPEPLASPAPSSTAVATVFPSPSPSPAAPIRHGPTPTDRLAGQIRLARLFLYRQARAAEDGVNQAANRVFGLERSFTETIASLAPSRESGERLMPGSVYVLVAAMAGSIVTRRSNILLRATVPLAFGVSAGWGLLPVTMRNCADLLWQYEERVPVIAQAHLQTRAAIERSVYFAKLHAQVSKNYADDKVHAVRETVEDWVKKGK
ncbi:hypothetical protein CMQ_1153 [Grosmannia clavigera kw1407]|uniref:MICOS complex subunit n=1 Tax=Grosmannia clavigera (strain kw1407 / UAMH 11150) TaxID=655863 RepID=F0XD82_GROCL|nr:uncharacterized protein CMQ_1153 [Grosmannia clavigera kw1407]EFX04225.1 hypothetical protein CMQ_1153 [Grosmannia clavigera kw1407]